MRLSSAFLSIIIFPFRLWLRFWRAMRFKCLLNYSWRLAWYMARRPS